ncbi:hypothetical protein MMC21_003953 [Puttea exsequens]|nr:hypothetical protein [Puttea exsequens]
MADVDSFNEQPDLYCLPKQVTFRQHPSVGGILLEQTEEMAGEFRRIGYITVFDIDDQEKDFAKYMVKFQTPINGEEVDQVLGYDAATRIFLSRFSIV